MQQVTRLAERTYTLVGWLVAARGSVPRSQTHSPGTHTTSAPTITNGVCFFLSRFQDFRNLPGPCPALINLGFRSHTLSQQPVNIMGIELFGRLLICKGASARPPRFISRQRGAKSNYHLRCLILQIIANKFTAGLTLAGYCVQVLPTNKGGGGGGAAACALLIPITDAVRI